MEGEVNGRGSEWKGKWLDGYTVYVFRFGFLDVSFCFSSEGEMCGSVWLGWGPLVHYTDITGYNLSVSWEMIWRERRTDNSVRNKDLVWTKPRFPSDVTDKSFNVLTVVHGCANGSCLLSTTTNTSIVSHQVCSAKTVNHRGRTRLRIALPLLPL